MITLERLACGTVFATHSVVPVYGYGDTETEALDALVEMHEMQYRTIEALTAKAREVREQLIALGRPRR